MNGDDQRMQPYQPDAAPRNHKQVKSTKNARKTSRRVYSRPALTRLRRKEISEKFQPGTTARAVALALGISTRTAAMDLSALGWPLRCGYRAPQRVLARRAEIVAAVQAAPKKPVDAFAAQFGVSRQRICQILKLAGYEKPRAPKVSLRAELRKRARDEQEAQRLLKLQRILSYHEWGWRQEAIGRAVGLPQSAVSRALRAAKAPGL